MLELKCDTDDASKKLVAGSVSASKMKTEVTAQMWIATLEDLRGLMQHRAQLLIGQPLTKHERLNAVRLPFETEDEFRAPPVVVWLNKIWFTTREGRRKREARRQVEEPVG